MRAMRLLGIGIGVGVAVDRLVIELRKPAGERLPWARRQVNENVNPWLLEHHVPGSAKAEIGTLEHEGRRSGMLHLSPVHPTLRGEHVLVPAPLGVGSQWAQNVLHAGRARLQLHETLHELDRPEVILPSETGLFPKALAVPFDRLGWRYVRFHVTASAPGAFAIPEHPMESALEAEPSLTEPIDIPMEPGMLAREELPV